MIEGNTIAEIFGPSGDGKTFFTLDILMRVQCGLDWNGRKVHAGNVLYVCAEGFAGIAARLIAWINENGYSDRDNPEMLVRQGALEMGNAESVAAMLSALREVPPLSVVAIDTVNASFGGDENNSRDMGTFLNGVRALRAELGVTVLLVHHTGHDNRERGRGHSSLDAAVDTVIQVCRDDSDSDLIGVRVTKQRNGENGARRKAADCDLLKPGAYRTVETNIAAFSIMWSRYRRCPDRPRRRSSGGIRERL
jgi:RecA-family ATPase